MKRISIFTLKEAAFNKINEIIIYCSQIFKFFFFLRTDYKALNCLQFLTFYTNSKTNNLLVKNMFVVKCFYEMAAYQDNVFILSRIYKSFKCNNFYFFLKKRKKNTC